MAEVRARRGSTRGPSRPALANLGPHRDSLRRLGQALPSRAPLFSEPTGFLHFPQGLASGCREQGPCQAGPAPAASPPRQLSPLLPPPFFLQSLFYWLVSFKDTNTFNSVPLKTNSTSSIKSPQLSSCPPQPRVKKGMVPSPSSPPAHTSAPGGPPPHTENALTGVIKGVPGVKHHP